MQKAYSTDRNGRAVCLKSQGTNQRLESKAQGVEEWQLNSN